MLIVADDPVALEVYAELFVLRGYAVVTAIGARDALRCARGAHLGLAVLALGNGAVAAQLRRRLLALSPKLPVHITGLAPAYEQRLPPLLRSRLH